MNKMRRMVYPLNSRWAFLLFCLLLFLFFESSIKFPFYAKEESVSKRGDALLVGEKARLTGAGSLPAPDSVLTELSLDDLNSRSISATKRDLLITNVNGRLSGISSQNEPLRNKNGRVSSIPDEDIVGRRSSASGGKPKKVAVNRSLNSNVPHETVAFSSPVPAPDSPSVSTKAFTTTIKADRSSTNASKCSASLSPVNLVNTTINHTKAFVAGSGMKPICSQTPPNLVGLVPIDKKEKPLKIIETLHDAGVKSGGFYSPQSCLARHRVAIVIPFRDRNEHLHIFLNHMMPFLKKQQLDFAIYIIELAPKEKFNRAMLMNIGFREALKDKNWQCFVFHDVDLLPEIDKNIYSCPANPRHMSAAVDTMNYKLPYHTIFGGVSAFSKAHFELINGFSNLFFGWGGEDDDLYYRTTKKGLKITRYPMSIARYTMLKHTKDKPNPDRFKYLKEGTKRMGEDGLNKLNYRVLGTERRKLFTKILVSIDENAVKKGYQVKRRRLRKRS